MYGNDEIKKLTEAAERVLAKTLGLDEITDPEKKALKNAVLGRSKTFRSIGGRSEGEARDSRREAQKDNSKANRQDNMALALGDPTMSTVAKNQPHAGRSDLPGYFTSPKPQAAMKAALKAKAAARAAPTVRIPKKVDTSKLPPTVRIPKNKPTATDAAPSAPKRERAPSLKTFATHDAPTVRNEDSAYHAWRSA